MFAAAIFETLRLWQRAVLDSVDFVLGSYMLNDLQEIQVTAFGYGWYECIQV